MLIVDVPVVVFFYKRIKENDMRLLPKKYSHTNIKDTMNKEKEEKIAKKSPNVEQSMLKQKIRQ